MLSIGEAANLIGVSVSTLRRWEAEERFLPTLRTAGGHRRYDESEILQRFFGKPLHRIRKTIAYSRVSSRDQVKDLERQSRRLQQHCQNQGFRCEVIEDLGSGINYQKRGLNQLLKMICSSEVERLVITHRDRLLRFGSGLIFRLCDYFNTEVVVLDDLPPKTFEEELAADVIGIMTVFTSKLYGWRSHRNRRRLAA